MRLRKFRGNASGHHHRGVTPQNCEAVRPTQSVQPSSFRPYQLEAFANRTHGIEVWNWGRQTGKSFTLAAWALDRLLTKPGRLVTILSNSRANAERVISTAQQLRSLTLLSMKRICSLIPSLLGTSRGHSPMVAVSYAATFGGQ